MQCMISKSNVKFTDSKVKLIAAIMRLLLFSSKQSIIKQLLDSVFVISRIIKVSVICYQPQPSASADNTYLNLDYSGYHKNLIQ